ncbi:MAG: formate/nitrite transporter family protein, partial [Alphaproteobacteria bacterium]
MPLVPLLCLGLLAGAFISFGAMLFTLTMTGNELGFGPGRLLGGLAFSLGLVLVIVGGAELFTGNNLVAMAWADGKVGTASLLRNWVLVYCANFAGAVATALMVHLSGILSLDGGGVGRTALAIAQSKQSLGFVEAFTRGVLANALVCLAVWLCTSTSRTSGKIMAIIFPISAFVALGFEHSIANMYFLAVAWFDQPQSVSLAGVWANLLPVTLGNIVGGSVFVALIYWLIYLRPGGSAD